MIMLDTTGARRAADNAERLLEEVAKADSMNIEERTLRVAMAEVHARIALARAQSS